MWQKVIDISVIGTFILTAIIAVQGFRTTLHSWLVVALVAAIVCSAVLYFFAFRRRSHEQSKSVKLNGADDYIAADLTATFAIDKLRETKLQRITELLGWGRYLAFQKVPPTAGEDFVKLWRDLMRIWRDDVSAYLKANFHVHDYAGEFLDTTGVQVAQDVQFHFKVWDDMSYLNAYLRNLAGIQRTLARTTWPVA
jgi:hypothetical protein